MNKNFVLGSIFLSLFFVLLLFGCYVVSDSVQKYNPENPLGSYDTKALGYADFTSSSKKSFIEIFGSGVYTYEKTINGVDYFKIVSSSFTWSTDANKKYNELSSGFKNLDTNFGRAAVLGNKALSYYDKWVVEITAPSEEKASILAQRFVNKIKKGIEFEKDLMGDF